MALNAGRWFWLRSLLKGKFVAEPGIRLYGKGRAETRSDCGRIARIEKRVKGSMWLKGARLLWTDFTHVRDIEFTDYKPISYPMMMDGMWAKAVIKEFNNGVFRFYPDKAFINGLQAFFKSWNMLVLHRNL